jgi:signal transduction histidine kinase/CheY-like chemotaxis protein
MLIAGLVALGMAAFVAVRVVQQHLEARLVENAVQRTETLSDELDHAVRVVRAELRAVALAAESGRPFEVPTLVSFSALALRCVRGDAVLLEAATSSQAETLMERLTMPLPGEVVAVEGNRLLLAVRTRGVTVYALADVNDVVRAPSGWSAVVVPDPSQDPTLSAGPELQQQIAAGGVWAQRQTNQDGPGRVQAYTSTDDGVVLRLVAPLDSAREASWALTRSILLWSLLAVFPLTLLAWLLARLVTSPVRRLAQTVQRAGGGALTLPSLPPDEIGELGRAIQSLSQRLHGEAQALQIAVTFSRRANLLREPEQVFAALEHALNRALPDCQWHALSASTIEDCEEDMLAGYSTNLLRFLLGSEYEPPPPRLEDEADGVRDGGRDEASMKSLNVPVARLAEVGREGIQMVLRYREQVFGIVVGGVVPDEMVSRAELLCREAASALRNIELFQSSLANEKLAVLGRVVAGVSHELNNPLAFVLANLRDLETDLAEDSSHIDAVREALQGAERLERIVRDLMALSRGGSQLSPEDAELNLIVRDVADFWEETYPHVAIDVRARRPVYARVDVDRFRQVMDNVLVNALEAVTSREDARVDLRVFMSDGRALVQVTDNGPGIPKSDQERVFDAFFSTKKGGGTGLGLFLARSLVEVQDGKLTLVSSSSKGSVFQLNLPMVQRVNHPELRVIQGGLRHEGKTVPSASARPAILVVDDELQLVRALKRWLGRWGEVTGTTDPHHGLELAASGSFALILCDVDMPRMRGDDFVAALRDLNGPMAERVVLMTGASTVFAEGARVVRKPLDQKTIEELLQQA